MAKRRSLDETRSLLLSAGAALLAERGVSVTLDRISLIDVCRRAGLKTAGSAYKIWPNQDAYRSELLHELVVASSATFATKNRVDDVFGGDRQPSLDELIRVVAADNADLNREIYPTYLIVWLAQRTDAELAATFADAEDAWLEALVALFTAVVDAYDLEFVEPFDATVLGVTLSALVEGLTIRHRATPELLPDAWSLPTGDGGAHQDWVPFAVGVKALFDAYTRPRHHSRP